MRNIYVSYYSRNDVFYCEIQREVYYMDVKNKSGKGRNHARINLDALSQEEIQRFRERGIFEDGLLVNYFPKQPRYMENFQTTSDFTHQYLALEPGIDGITYRVFHYLCYVLQYDNWIDISTVWVAEKLNLKRQQVSRAISTLEKKGLLIRGEKIGRHYRWRLNPEASWKGTANARWNTIEDIPYSDFIEKKIQYGDEHGFPLGYLRGLRPIEGGRKTNATKEEIERDRAYNRAIRTRLYGEEYADGVDWKKLSEAEVARLHIRAAKARVEMEESGEWEELHKKYFPPFEKPNTEVIDITQKANRKKKAQELLDKLMSSDVDLDELEKLLKSSATR